MAALFSNQNSQIPRARLPQKNRNPRLPPPTTPLQPTVGINDYSSMRVNNTTTMDAAGQQAQLRQQQALSALANPMPGVDPTIAARAAGQDSPEALNAARMRAMRLNSIADAQRLQRGRPGMQRSATSVSIPAAAGVRNPFAMTGGRSNSWSKF